MNIMDLPECVSIFPGCFYNYNGRIIHLVPFEEQEYIFNHHIIVGYERGGEMFPIYFDRVSGYEHNREDLRLGSPSFFPAFHADNPIILKHHMMVPYVLR